MKRDGLIYKKEKHNDVILINKIINSCDKRKSIAPETKVKFANYLIAECRTRLHMISQGYSEFDKYDDLEDEIISILKKLKNLSKNYKATLLEHDAQCLYEKDFSKFDEDEFLIGLEESDPPKFFIQDILLYFEALGNVIKSRKTGLVKKEGRKRASQSKTYISDKMAIWVGNSYQNYFNLKPTSRGHGDNSPFERVCVVIGEELNIKISRSSMKKAALDISRQ